jgi:hypothetical protein
MTRTNKAKRQEEIDAMTDINAREEAQRNLNACYGVEFSLPGKIETWPPESPAWYAGRLPVRDLDSLCSKLKAMGVTVRSRPANIDKITDALVDAVYKRYKENNGG